MFKKVIIQSYIWQRPSSPSNLACHGVQDILEQRTGADGQGVVGHCCVVHVEVGHASLVQHFQVLLCTELLKLSHPLFKGDTKLNFSIQRRLKIWMFYVLLCLLLLNEFPHWWKQSCIVFLFQVGALQTFFCRLMLSSTSLFPGCSFIPCLWITKCWLYQCRMSSGVRCMYVCNKDVLKNVNNKKCSYCVLQTGTDWSK